jgi:Lrp/AsnC family leucine-responsive transcriptional regulator
MIRYVDTPSGAPMTALDPISRRILHLLVEDGRASYQAIADEVGLSRPAVMERVKRLEEGGYILGYTARLDRAKAGFPITAFVAVRYPATNLDDAEPAVRALEANPSVLECHHVAGEDCYILKVAAPSLEALERILRSLREPGLVAGTRPTIVLSSVFEKPGVVPVELD